MTASPTAEHGGRLRTAATLALCTVLGGGALALLLAGPLPGTSAVGALRGHPVPWWALLPVYAAAELVVVHVQARRETLSVSFSHLVLVVGLVCCSPADLLVAAVLGRGAVLLLVHRQGATKLFFNVALFGAEAAVAATCFRLLLDGAPPLSAHGMLAALAAVVVADLVSAAALTSVVALAVGDLDAAVLREAVTSGLVIALANTSVGLLLVVVLEADGPAVVLLGVVVAVMAVGYRGWTTLSRAVHRLEALHQFTRRIGRADLPDVVSEAALREARDVMAAEVAELVPVGETGGQVVGALRLAGDRLVSSRRQEPTWWAPAAAGTPVRLTRGEAARTGVPHGGLAAPLEVDGAVVAVLVVLDRLAHLDDFTAADLRLFASLTDQTGAALHKAHLLDRVRRDAEATEHRSLHDGVTGLPNRRHVVAALDAALAAGGPVAVCVLDLRGFGDVNQAFGHATGDLLLAEAGRRLASSHPGPGLVGRVGNDEFAVVLPGVVDEAAARAGADAVVRLLEEPFDARGAGVVLAADVGVALAHPDDDREADASTLLEHADAALYTAKARDGDGRGVALWHRAEAMASTRRLVLVGDLREAISRRELTVHFQPKVDPTTRAPVGAEALVRWRHPVFGALSPEEFVPLAEHAGLVGALTCLVLDAAVAECAGWRAEHPQMSVAVNLSARSLVDEEVVDQVRAALEHSGLPPGALVLEVTETAVMTDLDRALVVLHRLRALGVRLSIDDFGTGQASLAYLCQLPADEMKIDRSFVRAMATDSRSASIVRSAVDLAHALGLTVVAEGVEDEATLALLADWGCDVAQGYVLSRPLPAEQLGAWLLGRPTGRHGRLPAHPLAGLHQRDGGGRGARTLSG